MNQKINKLIELAVVDGQITEKERIVILKKAAELGVDLDEVEMILNAKQHQLEHNTQNEKVGNIKTCPSCGATVKSFQFICDDCGHEFKNTKVDGYINDFKKTIEKAFVDKNKNTKANNFIDPTSTEKAIAELIKSYPLPKTKEDLIELLIYAHSNYESEENQKVWGISIQKPFKDAWYAKSKQALELLEIYGEKDKQSQVIINKYRQYFNDIIKQKSTPKKKGGGCLKYLFFLSVITTILALIVSIIPLSEEDKKLKTEIYLFLDQNKLDSAILRINYIDNVIEQKKIIDKIFNKAIEINDFSSAKKVINFYDSEYDKEEAMKKIYRLQFESE
jgi:hypothetical protein